MKQIIQDMKSGRTVLEEVPVPQVKSGYVLVKTSCSLVSLGDRTYACRVWKGKFDRQGSSTA